MSPRPLIIVDPREPRARPPQPLPEGLFADAKRAVRAWETDEAIGDPYRAMYTDVGTVRHPDVSVHSFFRDLLLVAESEARAQRSLERALEQGGRGGRDEGPQTPPASWGADDVEAARRRLAAAAKRDSEKVEELRNANPTRVTASVHGAGAEFRDITSAAGSGGEFVPAGAAVYIAEAFAPAAVGRGSLYAALPKRPLPQSGAKWEVPRFSAGASVAVQASENAAVSETDPTTALASANIATVAGQVDSARQLWDFARPGFDQALAADLGSALGAAVDTQLITGSNASGQTLGLANVSGINAVTWTDASPTAAEFVSKLWEAFRLIAEGGGGPAEPGPETYVIAVHPRRLGFIAAASGNTAGLAGLPPLPRRLVATTGVRTNLGGGTEDEAYVIARDEVFVSGNAPRFRAHESVGSSTLTVRFQAMQFLATMFSRRPKAIARISGTGMVAPTL